MNKSESKYFNTALRMDDALLSLLEEKDYQYITIRDICERAQVNRSTFYLHYEHIGDLLTETISRTTEKLQEKFSGLSDFDERQIAEADLDRLFLVTPEYLVPYLEFVKENKRIFKVAVAQPSVVQTNAFFNQYYTEIFRPILARFGMEETEGQYRLTFYLNGMFSLICAWIKNDCTEEIPYIADLLIKCIRPRRI